MNSAETERTIVVIKPGGVRETVGGVLLPRIVTGLLSSAGLEVTQRETIVLDEPRVRRLYPILEVPDLVYGEGWKVRLITHMTGGQCEALVVEGVQAQRRAVLIKRLIRQALRPDDTPEHRVINNLIHVPDPEEFCLVYDVLFNQR